MDYLQFIYDVSVNLCSSVLFVLIIAFILWLLRRGELTEAERFFGLSRQAEIKIYISGHEHAETVTKKVVTAMEYHAAIIIRDALQHLSGLGLINRTTNAIAGLIGQPPQIVNVTVEVSPLEAVDEPLLDASVILIGGPLRNQWTAYYANENPFLKFDVQQGKFVERVGKEYKVVEDSNNVVILEKMNLDGQVVISAFGTGEKHTKAAAAYLAANWRQLNTEYPNISFGIRMSIDDQGRIKVEKRLCD